MKRMTQIYLCKKETLKLTAWVLITSKVLIKKGWIIILITINKTCLYKIHKLKQR